MFDLAPLIGTSLNEALILTKGTARAASPLFRPPPPKGKRLVAAVGGEESAEFLRQSREIAENWSKVGVDAECEVIAGTNHFTVVDELIRPGSALHAHRRHGAGGDTGGVTPECRGHRDTPPKQVSPPNRRLARGPRVGFRDASCQMPAHRTGSFAE